jgi:hypothetical protein
MEDQTDAPPMPDESSYPPFVTTEDDRKRWRLAEQVAREVFGTETPAEVIWLATRALYRSTIPT